MKIALVAGARPNFMKVAPVLDALRSLPPLPGGESVQPLLVHSGQHWDEALSGSFLRELGLPEPDAFLGAAPGSQARQTASILVAFEEWLDQQRPDAVLVVGDVNTTLACAISAAKAGVLLAHVEAGLRSGDRAMPEEINRLAVDAISDLHFATERAAVENLRREGHDPSVIHLVGNTMIDSLLRHREQAMRSDVLERLRIPEGHVTATLHRPANVDDPIRLEALLEVLAAIASEAPVVLPLHPRTRARCEAAGLSDRLAAPGLLACEPLGYLDFLKLMATSRAVLTDSGGIQEETTVLGIPCLTLRDNTERPVTVQEGTNRLAGTAPEGILRAWRDLASRAHAPVPGRVFVPGRVPESGRVPEFWDGRAGARIARLIVDAVAQQRLRA